MKIFNFLTQKISELKNVHIAVITDREPGISKAFDNILPNLSEVHFCNHVKSDFIFFLQSHLATNEEIKVYVLNLEQLLKSPSESEFDYNVDKLTLKWRQQELVYLNKKIELDILNRSVRWVTENFNLYNPYSSATNNISDTMNTVIEKTDIMFRINFS